MDAFINFFNQYGDYFRLAGIILSVASAVTTIVILIVKNRKFIKVILSWAAEAFADGKITKEEFAALQKVVQAEKDKQDAEEVKAEEEKKLAIKVKNEKAKVKEEKVKVVFKVAIKAADGTVLFSESYASKRKARKGIKKALEELIAKGLVPASYKITKVKSN